MTQPQGLHVQTPLILSEKLSSFQNTRIYLKMESSQIAGSFKIRGIGNFAQKSVSAGCHQLLGCSGGNAGIAVANAAKTLGVPSLIYVPQTTSKRSIKIMEDQGATVIVKGKNYHESLNAAIEESKIPGNVLIHAYDHPDIWAGHSTIIHEIKKQLEQEPSLIVVPVGGGGLLCGILEGMEKVGWAKVPVLSMETQGAHCFNLSVKAQKVVPLEEITSIARTLGARTVPQYLMDILPKFNVISEVVSDTQAVQSCLRFAEDHGTVVEPSSGTALAAVYYSILQRLTGTNALDLSKGPVVVIVTGGSSVDLQMLHEWGAMLSDTLPPTQVSGSGQ